MTTENYQGFTESLQVSYMKAVPALAQDEEFKAGKQFIIKNVSGGELEVNILPRGNGDYITTTLFPGWNPEIVKAIKGEVSAGQLQIGY